MNAGPNTADAETPVNGRRKNGNQRCNTRHKTVVTKKAQMGGGSSEMPPEVPFRLQYELTRQQRIVPHLKIWMPFLFQAAVVLAGAVYITLMNWWFFPSIVFVLLLMRGFWLGLIDIVAHRARRIDIVVEGNGDLGVLDGDERWWLSLGVTRRMEQLTPGIWTLHDSNGNVINIPAFAMTDEQLRFLKEMTR
jgi:hypothetical protein